MSDIMIGYARVSTKSQRIDIQIAQIEAYINAQGKTPVIFHEKASGRSNKRNEIAKAICLAMSSGAPIVVTSLDRLSRNVEEGMEIFSIANEVHVVGRGAVSITEAEPEFVAAENEVKRLSAKTKDALLMVRFTRAKEQADAQLKFDPAVCIEYAAYIMKGMCSSRYSDSQITDALICAWDIYKSEHNFASPLNGASEIDTDDVAINAYKILTGCYI